MRLTPVMKGLVTYIPGTYDLFANERGIGTYSARFCYGAWLKHLTILWENGMRVIPETVAELGPGSSLGMGLAALLSGVKNYYALDVVKSADAEHNLIIFDELVDFFKKRAGRTVKGWPDFDRHLDSNLFPSHILTEKVLDSALTQKRIESIKNALLNMNSEHEGISIRYFVPWYNSDVIEQESVDVILSHAVLEHVTNLEDIYRAFFLWLRPKGWMSHQIDLKSHSLTKEWNGHWAYPELLWKIIVGKRPYLINRQPCSRHTALIKENDFKIICYLQSRRPGGIKRSQLASRWRDMSDDDLTCSNLFIIASKI